MKLLLSLLFTLPLAAQTPAPAPTPERLGTVSFPISCAPASQASFNRGVALLHDFWYAESTSQFERLVKDDPKCAMAHWGLAMSSFHQIWNRPGPKDMKDGWAQMKKAHSSHPGTPRERDYIDALSILYKPGKQDFPTRIAAYAQAMGALAARYPDDVDAGAFYALALLAAEPQNDTSLASEHQAMAVLQPLFLKYPDNPGVDHYITHACDNPAMAPEGLAAANHYLEIAQSGPHAYHMPGHIYARLGLWSQDIASQLGSIAAAEKAEAHGESGMADEPHSYDFLLYAELQSGQDKRAKATLDTMPKMLAGVAAMPGGGMQGMVPYFQTSYSVFYALEMRDWKAAAALEPAAGVVPEVANMVYWARVIADGHQRRGVQAAADLAHSDALIAEIRKGKYAYIADGTGEKVRHDEMLGWVSFAQGQTAEALTHMRAAADLQDKVGQGEVDIPAREMLADMLLESGKPQQALVEYKVALTLSPNRLNGLYNAGRAAQASGDSGLAATYFAALMKSTNAGVDSSRPEFAIVRDFLSGPQMAQK